jgi:hypothetical protein
MNSQIKSRIVESGLEPMGMHRTSANVCHIIAGRATTVDYGDKSGYRIDAWSVRPGSSEMTHVATLVFAISGSALATEKVKRLIDEQPDYMKRQAVARMKEMLDTGKDREKVILLTNSPEAEFHFTYPQADPLAAQKELRGEILRYLANKHLHGARTIQYTELENAICGPEEWIKRNLRILGDDHCVTGLSDGNLKLTDKGYVAAEQAQQFQPTPPSASRRQVQRATPRSSEETGFQYDVALSYAGEDRAYVEQVAQHLEARGVRVFYDKFEEAKLWGRDLYVFFTEVFQNQARFTVMFVSKHYAAKAWTTHERKAAQARAFKESIEYILPARFDDTEIPGILPTTGYIWLPDKTPQDLADLTIRKLEHRK